jgi:hypothetical protein
VHRPLAEQDQDRDRQRTAASAVAAVTVGAAAMVMEVLVEFVESAHVCPFVMLYDDKNDISLS